MEAGLGYVLYIDADGQGGSTAACETFASPALINASDPFVPASSPTKSPAGAGASAVPILLNKSLWPCHPSDSHLRKTLSAL